VWFAVSSDPFFRNPRRLAVLLATSFVLALGLVAAASGLGLSERATFLCGCGLAFALGFLGPFYVLGGDGSRELGSPREPSNTEEGSL
jgi:hypothetical protein